MIYYQRLGTDRLIYIHAKLAVILWGLTYLIYPLKPIVDELGYSLIYTSALSAIFGSLLGIIGLLRQRTNNINRRYQGLIMEFSGLMISFTGPLGFFFTAAYLTTKYVAPQGYSLTVLAYALCAAMIGRILTVWRDLKAAS